MFASMGRYRNGESNFGLLRQPMLCITCIRSVSPIVIWSWTTFCWTTWTIQNWPTLAWVATVESTTSQAVRTLSASPTPFMQSFAFIAIREQSASWATHSVEPSRTCRPKFYRKNCTTRWQLMFGRWASAFTWCWTKCIHSIDAIPFEWFKINWIEFGNCSRLSSRSFRSLAKNWSVECSNRKWSVESH